MADPQYSQAVNAARARRGAGDAAAAARDEWFVDSVQKSASLTMQQRTLVAVNYLRDKIVKNISIPVVKETNSSGEVVVTVRSKPGEYPRADTTTLMKTMFSGVDNSDRNYIDGFVGTPLDYGLELEVDATRDRVFMMRTFHEQLTNITRIFNSPLSLVQ